MIIRTFIYITMVFLLLLILSALGIQIPFIGKYMIRILATIGIGLGIISAFLIGIVGILTALFSSISLTYILIMGLFKGLIKRVFNFFFGGWIESTRVYKKVETYFCRKYAKPLCFTSASGSFDFPYIPHLTLVIPLSSLSL